MFGLKCADIPRPVIASVAVLLAGFVLFQPRSAEAQACVGNPAGAGQFSIGGDALLNDGTTGWGGSFRANMVGKASLGGSIQVHDVDGVEEDINRFGVDLAWDLGTPAIGVCPLVGAQYSTWSDAAAGIGFDATEWRIPVALSVGGSFGPPAGVRLIPYAQAGAYYQRLSRSLEVGDGDIVDLETRETGTEFFGEGGAALAFGQFFTRAGLLFDPLDGGDPAVRLTVGFFF